MAQIIIVTGKIGSGKTYMMVNHMTRKYYYYDDVIHEFIPRARFILVSNIRDLKLEHVSLSDAIEEKGLSYVFSVAFLDDLRSQHGIRHIIFLIDEIQLICDRKFYDKGVFKFFQLSRHDGLDIYLSTQDLTSVAKEVYLLAEYVLAAFPRSKQLGNNFLYNKVINDERVGFLRVPKDKKVFNAYKSFKFEENEVPKSVIKKYALVGVALVVLCVIAFRFLFLGFFFGGSDRHSKALSPSKKVLSSDRIPFNKLQNHSFETHDVDSASLKSSLSPSSSPIDTKVHSFPVVSSGSRSASFSEPSVSVPFQSSLDSSCITTNSLIDEFGNTFEILHCPDGISKFKNGVLEWSRPYNRRERESSSLAKSDTSFLERHSSDSAPFSRLTSSH